MSLTNFTGTVTATALRNNFDDKTTTLASNAVAGQKDWHVFLRVTSLADTAALSARSVAFTPVTDAELRLFELLNQDVASVVGSVVTGTLTQDDGGDEYLVMHTFSTSVTTAALAVVDSRVDYRTTTGRRVRLKAGVRYRLTMRNTTAATTVGPTQITVQLRSVRRAA